MRVENRKIIYINKEEEESLMKAVQIIEKIYPFIDNIESKIELMTTHSLLLNVWNKIEIE